MSGELLDARGCLTAVGFARIAAAPPGRAPTELAAHLASCGRCQRRLLATGSSSSPTGKPAARRAPPPVWRAALVLVGIVVLVVMAMALLRHLTPPR